MKSIMEKHCPELLEKKSLNEEKEMVQINKTILLIGTPDGFMNRFKENMEGDWKVVSCEYGTEGLAIYQNFKPGFVFVTEYLEKLNERIVLKKIKELDKNNSTSVVLLHMSQFNKYKEEFDASMWVEHWQNVDFEEIAEIFNKLSSKQEEE